LGEALEFSESVIGWLDVGSVEALEDGLDELEGLMEGLDTTKETVRIPVSK
jgi:hypothetical protein